MIYFYWSFSLSLSPCIYLFDLFCYFLSVFRSPDLNKRHECKTRPIAWTVCSALQGRKLMARKTPPTPTRGAIKGRTTPSPSNWIGPPPPPPLSPKSFFLTLSCRITLRLTHPVTQPPSHPRTLLRKETSGKCERVSLWKSQPTPRPEIV